MGGLRQDPWHEIPRRRWFETRKRWGERRAMWATQTVLYWTSHLGGTAPWVPAEDVELAGLVDMVASVSDPRLILGIIEQSWVEQGKNEARTD